MACGHLGSGHNTSSLSSLSIRPERVLQQHDGRLFQVKLGGSWRDFLQSQDMAWKRAYMAGLEVVPYTLGSQGCQADFQRMIHCNLATRKNQAHPATARLERDIKQHDRTPNASHCAQGSPWHLHAPSRPTSYGPIRSLRLPGKVLPCSFRCRRDNWSRLTVSGLQRQLPSENLQMSQVALPRRMHRLLPSTFHIAKSMSSRFCS